MFADALAQRFPALTILPPGTYAVGGAVRDLILGREPADVDLACPDPLACAQLLRRKVIRLGSEDDFSAYRVVDRDQIYDFAPLLGNDIQLDLRRRDFTMNAMAVELASNQLLDPFGGRNDLAARLVRMVEAKNFDDDPLRLIKSVRMAVTYGFTIEPRTLEATRERASFIARVAPERVTVELAKIFSANRFRTALALLRETGLDVPLFGRELDADAFAADDVPLAGAMALLVREPRAHAEQWRWSEALLREALALQRLLGPSTVDRRIALFDAGSVVARQLAPTLRAVAREAEAAEVERLATDELFATRPLLTGEEIAAERGIAPGVEVGRLKRAVVEAQLRGEITTREEALALLRR